MSRARVAIDFDYTLCEWGGIEDTSLTFLPGAAEALLALDARYEVWIHTSRVSTRWHEESALAQTSSIERQREVVRTIIFNETGLLVPDERITADKVPAHAYIDDRAIAFRGDWPAVLAQLEAWDG